MATKHVSIWDAVIGGSPWHSADYDHVNFKPNWVELTDEATDIRLYYSWGFADVKRIVISPIGISYPGDATPGSGAKTVTVNFKSASIVMTLVENVDFSEGWLVITKGEHIIAFSSTIVFVVTVEPS